ncbi:hypothetical protein [Aureimonas sp. AU40]|uniref:hypothetical protein n=1 Tax=Aureimonas sp. AU40 TaxID=1637747 RepID=UPI0007833D5D|nr:hypothetical protein [Aureimonas sp. AU40]
MSLSPSFVAHRRGWIMPAAALALLLAVSLPVAPVAAPRIAHAAFLALLPVPMGCVLLLLVHALTGGEWGRSARPALLAGAGYLPFVCCLALPPLLFMPSVFLWAGSPELIAKADAARFYFSAPALALRTLVTLGLWNGLAVFVIRRERPSPALAGFCLLVFGVSVSTAGVDWVLALAEPLRSTAFPMSLAISFLLAGAAFAGGSATGERAEDWAKLTATFALGLTYLDAMQFLVAYDGNLPEQARWYGARGGWVLSLLGLAFLLAALLPVLTVFRKSWRRAPEVRRALAVAVPVGVGLRALWFAVPSWEPGALFWLLLLVLLSATAALPILAGGQRA